MSSIDLDFGDVFNTISYTLKELFTFLLPKIDESDNLHISDMCKNDWFDLVSSQNPASRN